MKTFFIFTILLTCFIGNILPNPIMEQAEEDVLKSVTIQKLSKYIEWPENVLKKDDSSPFVIGAIGRTDFDSILRTIYKDNKIKGKQVKIKKVRSIHEIFGCHVLYIAETAKKILPDIINFTRDKPILTISDTTGFAEKGVLINIVIKGNKIRFEINEKGTYNSGIKVSSMIKRFSKIIDPLKPN